MGVEVDRGKCVSCGRCAEVCKMDVDITRTPNHGECIRCGKCVTVCPVDALAYGCGFGSDGKEMKKETEK